jgi:hypothetical protein
MWYIAQGLQHRYYTGFQFNSESMCFGDKEQLQALGEKLSKVVSGSAGNYGSWHPCPQPLIVVVGNVHGR